MNQITRTLMALTLVGALAACAPAADEPGASTGSTEPAMSMSMSSAPMPSTPESGSPEPFASPDAMASHDMGEMGGETATIEIVDFAFTPAELTSSAGTEVTVTNLDSAPHTFTAGSDANPQPDVFDSGLLQQGESFTFVFDEPGSFAYYCDRHPPMEGEITVPE